MPRRILSGRRRPGRFRLAVVIMLLPALTGCAFGQGPLDNGFGDGSQLGVACWTNLPRALGGTWLQNTDEREPVVLQSAALGVSNGRAPLHLDGSFVIRYPQKQVFGFGLEVPPTRYHDAEMEAEWASKEELKGAVIPPGEGLNVVLVVSSEDAGKGASEWFDVHYRVGRAEYTLRTNVGLEFDDGPPCADR